MSDWLVQALMLFGAGMFLVGGLGLLRFPDVFMRASGLAKVLTIGTGCLLLAAAIHFNQAAVTTRALVVIAFFLLTSPVSAHLIGRAAYLSKTPLWKNTGIDELRGRYDLDKHVLKSPPPGSGDPDSKPGRP